MIKCEICGNEFEIEKLKFYFEENVEPCYQNPELLVLSTDTLAKCPVCGNPILINTQIEMFEKEDVKEEINLDQLTKSIIEANEKNGFIEKPIEIPELKIRYHKEIYPDLPPVEQHGNFIDLYSAETVMLNKGDFHLLDLGVSVEIPAGYWLQIVPRSSTFKNWGILQVNSFGVVDTSYCGDNDILKMPIFATRDICIPANTRICQFRLVKDNPFEIIEVEKLNGPDRGGFGSTGQYEEKN